MTVWGCLQNRELDELQRRIKELEVEANRAATLQKDFDELRQEVLGGEVTTPRKSESGSVLAKQFKAKVERLEDQLQELKQRNLELSRDCMSLSEERKEIRHVLEEKVCHLLLVWAVGLDWGDTSSQLREQLCRLAFVMFVLSFLARCRFIICTDPFTEC